MVCVVQLLELGRASGVVYQQLGRRSNYELDMVAKLCITEERKSKPYPLGCARDTHWQQALCMSSSPIASISRTWVPRERIWTTCSWVHMRKPLLIIKLQIPRLTSVRTHQIGAGRQTVVLSDGARLDGFNQPLQACLRGFVTAAWRCDVSTGAIVRP